MSKPLPSPLLLEPANFTPRSRTPWGGPRLPALKAACVRGPLAESIGESWEISVEPDFPSRVESEGLLLEELLAEAPEAWLGEGRSMELLVKLLDAEAPLSVQIHPCDDDPALAPGQGGKPEAWYIVDHAPGAGVYLGLAEGVTEAEMREAVLASGDASRLLRFHPVARGDFFLVEPGVPHAVGPGVLLVEPQRVARGKRGLTYRYWDWGRLYDSAGRESPSGSPRPLHLERALEVTDWSRPRGASFDAAVRRSLGAPREDALYIEPLSGAEGGIPSEDLTVFRVAGSGGARLPALGALAALTLVRGELRLSLPHGGEARVTRGRTLAIPAALMALGLELHGEGAEALLSAAPRA